MSKLNLKSNVITTIKILETIFLLLMAVFSILPKWGAYYIGNWYDEDSIYVKTSFINYSTFLGVLVIICSVVALITIWTKIYVISLSGSIIQFISVLYVVIRTEMSGSGAYETGTAHFIISILSVNAITCLFIDSKNKKVNTK